MENIAHRPIADERTEHLRNVRVGVERASCRVRLESSFDPTTPYPLLNYRDCQEIVR